MGVAYGNQKRPIYRVRMSCSDGQVTFAYGRVSTSEQSADNQRLEIESAGHKVDYWFADTISGKSSASQRPQFSKLLGQIRDGETLVVSKLDRLGRDAQDVGATVKLLARANNKPSGRV